MVQAAHVSIIVWYNMVPYLANYCGKHVCACMQNENTVLIVVYKQTPNMAIRQDRCLSELSVLSVAFSYSHTSILAYNM